MTALLTVLASVVGYLTVGVFYARSQMVGTYRRAKTQWYSDSSVQSAVTVVAAFRVFLWPGFLPFDMLRGPVGAWMRAPVDTRRARAAQLREDAAAWRDKRHTGTAAERAMADELARMCEERAREVDL